MKNLFYSLALIFLFCISFACKKEESDLDSNKARLQGKVLEKGSNKPLVGWTVYLSSCDCVLLSGCNCELKDSTITGSDGSYSYESLLWKFDPEVRQSLTTTSQLKAIITNGKPLITTTDERVLGELLPNFIHLGNTIFNVKLIEIGEKHYFGGGDILVSFDTSLNLYITPSFALTNRELASV